MFDKVITHNTNNSFNVHNFWHLAFFEVTVDECMLRRHCLVVVAETSFRSTRLKILRAHVTRRTITRRYTFFSLRKISSARRASVFNITSPLGHRLILVYTVYRNILDVPSTKGIILTKDKTALISTEKSPWHFSFRRKPRIWNRKARNSEIHKSLYRERSINVSIIFINDVYFEQSLIHLHR